ncbi:RimJ/RimL family protein N-acetyltransferase [Cytobacillus eiseniae]|uniref:RimJ/RimL family protein N-acetyltransferase n=1 Tax=Cytobacillus eiseniae TaxID=762947 RepID=A0ABS4RK14_9BACI|nr:GNAT family protein [Cytobacillus eiseniae]MBP2242756.1 RimJ/RimL family protein N-acetyltransferase [Cytobacillus eiseniae]
MQLFMQKMNERLAIEILNWKYEAPYNFYNNELTSDSIKELLEETFYAVVDQNNQLVGFFCIGKPARVPIGSQYGAYADDFIDIGLGLKPELTGQGHGFPFFSFVLTFVRNTYHDIPIRLTVAKFNKRAIHLYEKIGFTKQIEFSNGETIFLTMLMEKGDDQ